MRNLYRFVISLDVHIATWLARHAIQILRVSLGTIFLWFGGLKFFPGLSPADDLATRTIDVLTMGMIPSDVAIFTLASWECLIGILLLLGVFMRFALVLLWLQMLGTITPIFLFPREVFLHIPYAPTLEGQYIIKNIVVISASLVVGATVRGGGLVADQRIVEQGRREGESS